MTLDPTRNDTLLSAIRSRIANSEFFPKIAASLDGGRLEIAGLPLEARALVIATLQESAGKPFAIVVPSESVVDDLEMALRLFASRPDRIATFPSPSLSPYNEVPTSLAVLREEVRALKRITSGNIDFVIIPARSVLRRLPRPVEHVARILTIARDSDLDLDRFASVLTENGYRRTDLVGSVGEYARRGGILDLYPPDLELPVRIELFGDTIESIRYFDPDTQRSEEECIEITISPTALFPSTKSRMEELSRRIATDFKDPSFRADISTKLDLLTGSGSFAGIESFLPITSASASIADYLDTAEWCTVAVEPGEIDATLDRYALLLAHEYRSEIEKGRAVYPPDVLLTPRADVDALLERSSIALSSLSIKGGRWKKEIRLDGRTAIQYLNRLGDFPSEVRERQESGLSQIFFASSRGGKEKIERLLNEFQVSWEEEPDDAGSSLAISRGEIAHGFEIPEIGLRVVSEWDLFEHPANAPRSRRRKTQAFQTDLRDLKTGDYVVHLDHGIGRFAGLRRLAFGDSEREVMEIQYQNAGKLLLPVENLNLIQKYSSGEEGEPRLDRLGGTTWTRTKASVRKALRDMADELIQLYATRETVGGHAFSKDSPWQHEFEDGFEFEETEDQTAAIEDVKRDMESRKPMDRLLCGDVGYGKTEVAMRAAFKAVLDGRQVAVLAPTTILAFQHHRTFCNRFASFPVTIELLSRHWGSRDQKAILEKTARAEIDILIGTHRILSKDIEFRDLGLLIVDEEQRFGVAQKERLKHLKKNVDVLAMSATPIPRTLHMSLAGIRDISIIETPPRDRLAIQTAIVPFDDEIIREAVEFETARGGQVFFVHNRIESIHAMKEYLERLIPGLRVVVGHGQIDERDLEKAMMAFIAREYDLLLSTTIIENGIDIPACNTILINHAERFGLSQLYQLRGRVGRSDRLAFCYPIVPSNAVLSSEARKRLAAIQEFSDLGAGFRIAARDLEIRGSGNLLGGEQSGNIAAVGFEMYTRLLEEAMRELKGEDLTPMVETELKLGLDIYIPHDYISDENLRMMFYKRIASAHNRETLDATRGEIRDRFGAIPDRVSTFFDFVTLKNEARELGVTTIVRNGSNVAIRFEPNARIEPNRLFELVSLTPGANFSPEGVLTLPLETTGPAAMISELRSLLERTTAVA